MCGLFPCTPILGVIIFSFFNRKRYYGMRGLGFAINLFQSAAKHTTRDDISKYFEAISKITKSVFARGDAKVINPYNVLEKT